MAQVETGDPRIAHIVKQMARKLQGDILILGKLRDCGPPKTFPRFRDIRSRYQDILGLIFSIHERLPEAGPLLPANLHQWTLRQKLSALAIFTDISFAFISDPPLALTSSLGASEVLLSEQKSFNEVLDTFDNMLMEAGIDDKTADELDATRTKIEKTLEMIGHLLEHSPAALEEFS